MLRAPVQDLVAQATWRLGFVHPGFKSPLFCIKVGESEQTGGQSKVWFCSRIVLALHIAQRDRAL
jgi:hypothetical protein